MEMFIYGADNIKKFYKLLYDDSTVSLDRKLKKFEDFYNTYNEIRKSKSGKQGVYLDKRSNKWIATIYLNNERIRLGSFKCVEDAIEIREKYEIEKCRLNQ